jgi:hypothetical protein
MLGGMLGILYGMLTHGLCRHARKPVGMMASCAKSPSTPSDMPSRHGLHARRTSWASCVKSLKKL